MQLPAHNRPVLGILPLGTANDFAMACNIPRRRNRRCSWRSGRSVPIDLAKVNGERYFINMAPAASAPASPPKRRRS